MRSVRPIRTIVSGAVLIMASSTANAGSFSLYTESSPAAIGNYAAGIAAEAADASTGWYNPAGLPLLGEKEVVGGLVVIAPSAKLSGSTTFATQGFPSYVQAVNDVNGLKMGYVPSFHAALPLSQNVAIGLSINGPFGLSTQWDQFGPLRYAATTSQLLTVNTAPEIGVRFAEHFSLGLGLDLQYAGVKFNQVLGSPAQVLSVNPMTLDSLSYNRGYSIGVGAHVGGMALFNEDHTRIGLNYQSQLRHRFHGYSRLQGRLASLSPAATSSAILAADPESTFWSFNLSSNGVILPNITTLSVYQDINESLALLGSVVYTGWSSLKTLELRQVAAFVPTLGQVFVNSSTPEHYRDVWRFAVGANYHVNERWMLRVGGGYDQTPTRNAFRDIRVPDGNRWATSIGTHYQLWPTVGLDFGYTHLFSSHSRVNTTAVAGVGSTYNVNTDIKAYANLLALQLVWFFDKSPPVVATK